MRSGIKLDHKRILEETACLLDTFRLREDQLDLDDGNLSALKQRLHSARSLEELVVILGSIPEALQAMARVVEEHCLQELITMGEKEGSSPLSQWPNSTKHNYFSEVVKFALRNSPVTLSFVLKMAVKDFDSNVQPR